VARAKFERAHVDWGYCESYSVNDNLERSSSSSAIVTKFGLGLGESGLELSHAKGKCGLQMPDHVINRQL
jgi:hypothetical protein